MTEVKNLEHIHNVLAERLCKSIALLDIMEQLFGDKVNAGALISILQDEINSAFNENEECRKMISIPN